MSEEQATIAKIDALIRGQLPSEEAQALRDQVAASTVLQALYKDRMASFLLYEQQRRNDLRQLRDQLRREPPTKKNPYIGLFWSIFILLTIMLSYLGWIARYGNTEKNRRPSDHTITQRDSTKIAPNAIYPPAQRADTPQQHPKKTRHQTLPQQPKNLPHDRLPDTTPPPKNSDMASMGTSVWKKELDKQYIESYFKKEKSRGESPENEVPKAALTDWQNDTTKAHRYFRSGRYTEAALIFSKLESQSEGADKYAMQWFYLLSRLKAGGPKDQSAQNTFELILSTPEHNFIGRTRELKHLSENH